MNREPGRAASLLAHPDDAEFLCAGTLALLARAGWRVTIITATPGDCGSATVSPEEIARVRRVEAAKAASVIGASYLCLELRDLSIDYNTESRRRFTEALRQVRPSVVFTHPLADYMADHEIVGRLTRDACFAAPMPNFRGDGSAAPLEHIPHLYYCDPFQPGTLDRIDASLVVDVTGIMEIKKRMLAHHESQREWLRVQHGIDEYLRVQEALSQERGATRGLAYGEGFQQHRGHPYPQDDLLGRVIGQLIVDS